MLWCSLRFPHKTINVREYRRDNQKWTTGNIKYIRRRKSKQRHNTICVWHHYAQTHTNNVGKTWALLQATGGMFDSTSPPVVCRRAHVLLFFLCVCLRIVMSNILSYHVFTFWVPYCDDRYDSNIKRFSVGIYTQLFVVWLMSYLRYLCLYAYNGAQHMLPICVA